MDDDASATIENTPLVAPSEEGLNDATVVEAIYGSIAAGLKVKAGRGNHCAGRGVRSEVEP